LNNSKKYLKDICHYLSTGESVGSIDYSPTGESVGSIDYSPTGESVGSFLLLFEPTDLPVGAEKRAISSD